MSALRGKPSGRIVVVGVAAVAAIALVVWLVLGPLSPSRRLAARISAETGMPCAIASVSPAGDGFEIGGLRLGRESEWLVEVDRIAATGAIARRRLDTLSMTDGRVTLKLPDLGTMNLTGIYLSAGNLEAITGGAGGEAAADAAPATVALSGQCFDLNPILKEHGKIRFLRGRFTLSFPLPRMGGGEEVDVPVRIILTDFHVQSIDGRFAGEAGSAEARVHVTGRLGDLRVDARELAPFLGGVDLSNRR